MTVKKFLCWSMSFCSMSCSTTLRSSSLKVTKYHCTSTNDCCYCTWLWMFCLIVQKKINGHVMFATAIIMPKVKGYMQWLYQWGVKHSSDLHREHKFSCRNQFTIIVIHCSVAAVSFDCFIVIAACLLILYFISHKVYHNDTPRTACDSCNTTWSTLSVT